jgi:hypothetical protein
MKYKIRYDLSKTLLNGTIVYRIEYVRDVLNRHITIKAGDLGGWIQSEHNLSQMDDSLIYDNAQVCGEALVCGEARVCDNAQVYGKALVCENAQVYGEARVYGEAEVYGEARVTKKIAHLNYDRYSITITDNHVGIGCEQHLIIDMLDKKFITALGKKHSYTKDEIIFVYRFVKNYVTLMRDVK